MTAAPFEQGLIFNILAFIAAGMVLGNATIIISK